MMKGFGTCCQDRAGWCMSIKPLGFVDLLFQTKSIDMVIKALYGFHQAQKHGVDIMLVQVYVDDIIFGSTKKSMCTEFEDFQDMYLADILKKYDFWSIRTATTPIELRHHVCVVAYARFQGHSKASHLIAVKSAMEDPALDRISQRCSANCCGQVLWIQNQMMDYGFNFMNTKIHIDNESTISVIKNPVAHLRTKHIKIRFHFIRDCYEKRLIEIIKIHTDSNVADLLTKGFDVTRFNFLVDTEILQSQGPTFTHVADEATTTGVRVGTEGATTTTSGLDVGLDSGNIHESPLRSHDTPLHDVNTSGSVENSLKLKESSLLVPKLELKIGSLEKELKETKQTFGNAILTLVDKVKSLEAALKRKSKKVILSESEDEETENQGRKIHDIDDDPLVSLVRDFVTPTKTKFSALREAQEEDISPTTLEAAKTLSKVASQKARSTDKGRRYKRRKMSKGKDIITGLDAEVEVNTGKVEIYGQH
ncbi:hypothetical protein Tco_0017302 [Tanacetum coccineum]